MNTPETPRFIHPELTAALNKGHVIPAILPDGSPFVRDGLVFYQAADDGISMYQGRFMQFSDVLERHDRLKLDESLLRTLLQTGRDSLRAAIARIQTDPEDAVEYLTDFLTHLSRTEQRLDLYADLEGLGVGSQIGRVFEIASVWFFTESDDPAVYDHHKGKKYCQLWQQYPELYGFFLRLPLARFAPVRALSPTAFQKSMESLQEMNRLDLLDYTRTRLKWGNAFLNSVTTTSLHSLAETLTAYDDSYTYLLKNFTSSHPPTSATT